MTTTVRVDYSFFIASKLFQTKDINARLEGIQPKVRPSDGLSSGYIAGEIKPLSVNPKKSSPKAKSSSRETSLFGG